MKSAALLLVDLQQDFLEREGLTPPRHALVARAAALLRGCRELGLPVFHVHTHVSPDGSDRMPHWKRADVWACVAGTPGAEPPSELAPCAGEGVFRKRFYSAFGAEGLAAGLEARVVKTLIVAGSYLHACVRATLLDAYERGYEVWVAGDAVGSTEPVHAELARAWLASRAARFADVEVILARLGARSQGASAAVCLPVACLGGAWHPAGSERRLRRGHPADLRRALPDVPLAGRETVAAAARIAARACPDWSARRPDERIALLESFAKRLRDARTRLADRMVEEVGKPLREARAEADRAVAHVETALRLLAEGDVRGLPGADLQVRYRPVGALALITPWNNPVAIPVGKLAPALAFGNAVVWKPAPQAPRTAMAVLVCLHEAGLPPDLVSLVFGDAETARHAITDPNVAAVSLTGSTASGRSAAALCAAHGKPLQAELGGNNPAIVLADCDLEAEARGLALAAFGFSGQRCTATRRILVERSALGRFSEALVAAVRALKLGDPAEPATEAGPLVTPEHRERVAAALEGARREGGRVLCGGGVPPGLEHGCYFEPTLVADLDPRAHLVREETFGPLAVILPADDLEDAIRLANRAEHGLVASLCTRDAAAKRRFAEAVEAGILKLAPGPLAVHAEAPFGGWKASGIGPPEHGVFDREFYARPQAVYGAGDEGPGC